MGWQRWCAGCKYIGVLSSAIEHAHGKAGGTACNCPLSGEVTSYDSAAGGDTGIPWGSFGVWDEPYDPQAARQARPWGGQGGLHRHRMLGNSACAAALQTGTMPAAHTEHVEEGICMHPNGSWAPPACSDTVSKVRSFWYRENPQRASPASLQVGIQVLQLVEQRSTYGS